MLTETETQRYDRQIRVWGAEAQSRIKESKVLICGLRGLHIEVIKNIVLAGVNVVLQDSTTLLESDLSFAFCCGLEHIGQNFACASRDNVQELNKFATVETETCPLEQLPDDFFDSFTAVLVSQCSEAQALRINTICRQNNPSTVFFWSEVWGGEACFISDFGESFEYKKDPPHEKDVATIAFPSLTHILSRRFVDLPSRHFPLSKTYVKFRLLEILRYANSVDSSVIENLVQQELLKNGLAADLFSPDELNVFRRVSCLVLVTTASILGSFLSQEVIKGISRAGVPAFNVFVFDSNDFVAKAFPID